jgi:hypothetical protein
MPWTGRLAPQPLVGRVGAELVVHPAARGVDPGSTRRIRTPLQWLVSDGCSAPPLPFECWPRLESSAIMSGGRLHLSFNAFHDGYADV